MPGIGDRPIFVSQCEMFRRDPSSLGLTFHASSFAALRLFVRFSFAAGRAVLSAIALATEEGLAKAGPFAVPFWRSLRSFAAILIFVLSA
jgi:hypothetical protein